MLQHRFSSLHYVASLKTSVAMLQNLLCCKTLQGVAIVATPNKFEAAAHKPILAQKNTTKTSSSTYALENSIRNRKKNTYCTMLQRVSELKWLFRRTCDHIHWKEHSRLVWKQSFFTLLHIVANVAGCCKS